MFPTSDNGKYASLANIELLYVLHFILYMPLVLSMSCGSLLCKLLYNVLLAQNAMCKLVE